MTLNEAVQLLDLSLPFTRAELKKAYAQALKVWHPDRFHAGDELQAKAHEKTRLIIETFEYLKRALGQDDCYPPSKSESRDSSETNTPQFNSSPAGQASQKPEPARAEPAHEKTQCSAGTPPPMPACQARTKQNRAPGLFKFLIALISCAVFAVVLAHFGSLSQPKSSGYESRTSYGQPDYLPSAKQDRSKKADPYNSPVTSSRETNPKPLSDKTDPPRILGASEGKRHVEFLERNLKKAETETKKDLPPIMKWTNMEGRSIKAGFGGLKGENIVFKMPDGTMVEYPLAKLSPESQLLAKECASE